MVRCGGCGYLAARNRETRQIMEVELAMRERGEMPPLIGNRGNFYEDKLLCFVRAQDIEQEQLTGNLADRLGLVTRERGCQKFTEWRQGLTPKEHWEFAIETARRRGDERRDSAQRKWQENEAKS